MPPIWLTVAVQVHPPPLAASVQVTSEKPNRRRGVRRSPRRSWWCPKASSSRPAARPSPCPSWSSRPCTSRPTLAVHVPVTLSEPEIVTFLQVRGSRPASEMSRLLPLSVRHDDAHVPGSDHVAAAGRDVRAGRSAPGRPPVPRRFPGRRRRAGASARCPMGCPGWSCRHPKSLRMLSPSPEQQTGPSSKVSLRKERERIGVRSRRAPVCQVGLPAAPRFDRICRLRSRNSAARACGRLSHRRAVPDNRRADPRHDGPILDSHDRELRVDREHAARHRTPRPRLTGAPPSGAAVRRRPAPVGRRRPSGVSRPRRRRIAARLGATVTSETPNRGRSKSTPTEPSAATATVVSGTSDEGSIACCSAAICAADGLAGMPCDTQTVYASPCDSSTRRCETRTRGAEARRHLDRQVHRRGGDRHEVVVIVPDQHLDRGAVQRGHAVDVRLAAHAVRENVVERARPAAGQGQARPGQAAEQLERAQHGQVDAVRGEGAIAGEIGRARKRERPGEQAAQLDAHLRPRARGCASSSRSRTRRTRASCGTHRRACCSPGRRRSRRDPPR